MEIGIGLPATIPGTRGSLVLDWAGRADSGPFSSLGIIDRLVYPNYETLVTLAAAAAVTERVRLMSTVLIAPLRGAGVLAKQAASVDALSGGRLTLGLGVGAREDDFQAAPAPFHDRARRFEEQLDLMKRVWSGQPVGDGVGPIGPPPARSGGARAIDRRLCAGCDPEGRPLGGRVHKRGRARPRAGASDVRPRGGVLEGRRKGRRAAARRLPLLRSRSERGSRGRLHTRLLRLLRSSRR
jgi:alkanesulfonate monooxygenase SsuD/methylene tetrahydromethanopterin reductase-like flavin-dependent oxidoreductase (luciferase family)